MHGCEAEKRLAARKAMTPTAVVWRLQGTPIRATNTRRDRLRACACGRGLWAISDRRRRSGLGIAPRQAPSGDASRPGRIASRLRDVSRGVAADPRAGDAWQSACLAGLDPSIIPNTATGRVSIFSPLAVAVEARDAKRLAEINGRDAGAGGASFPSLRVFHLLVRVPAGLSCVRGWPAMGIDPTAVWLQRK
jgi:hypothetical protein